MLCAMGATLIFVIIALAVYSTTSLPLIVGLPLFLCGDITLLMLCYFMTRKDRDMRNEFRDADLSEGMSPLFAEVTRDYRATHLESVWDSVLPSGWRLREVYKAEDKIEVAMLEKDAAVGREPCEMTIQFGEREVTVYFDYGDDQDTETMELTSSNFPDYPSMVIWLGDICKRYADKALSLKQISEE